jgi:DNA-binding NarL/FixJ family response regulator
MMLPLLPDVRSVTAWTATADATAEQTVVVSIVCGSHIYAAALQRLLDAEPGAFLSRIITSLHQADLEGKPDPDVALIAPQGWRQMAAWLPMLRRHLRESPWLLLADQRLVGMFLSFVEPHAAAMVEPDASPDELCRALQSVADQHGSHLPTELLSLFARGLGRAPNGRRPRLPSMIEFQCACGVSLGLCNREIAEALCLCESTIKSHLHRLMGRLDLSTRGELALLVERALAR